ncbi:hypothetical protein HNQ80_000236 [Anaerosolibacter carboniphilus]|uniref:Phosphatidic acid phosphatase type 2/haloperoxidase domain-containing protein n=1 Tax=Anaerosolibacter carboniphilus TaxID=1417629 RepID=A0A841KL42_9FIRM|nr:vanadium-dependent haloperoxidase [Anaerosolibacter carboniphilus]MBB6214167.1 hypothetical protein [Anaerosolibacter carboniphilus]
MKQIVKWENGPVTCVPSENGVLICKKMLDKLIRPVNLPRKWSELSYPGESRVPQGVDPSAGSWSMYFFKRDKDGRFITSSGQEASFEIQHPDNFNFDDMLIEVKEVLDNLTPKQKQIAEYWGKGPATKQWTPIIERLMDTYGFSPVRAARVLAAVQAGINDAFVITWYFKYLWDIPRPNQLDQGLVTAIATPKFPGYPSGHSVISGAAEIILSYFFPTEAERLKELAEEDGISRLYGGVHFIADITEGLRLGRQIGSIIVDQLRMQHDLNQSMIDIPIIADKHAELPPPPYEQIIPSPSGVGL